VSPQIDALLFGLDAEGNRLLPLRTPSQGRFDDDSSWWSYLIVAEVSDAREVNEDNFDALATRAMTIFLNGERTKFELHMVLDSDIFEWVNNQVRLSTILPTPTPPPSSGFAGLSQLGQ
jgi:hypothetical protein